MEKAQILERLLQIASVASEDMSEPQVKDTIVEPLYRIAKDLKNKGFIKESQITLEDAGQAGAVDGGPISPEQAAEISPGAAQAVNNQQQAVVDNTLQLSGPSAEIKLQITGPKGITPEQFMKNLEQLPQMVQQAYEGYTVVVPSEKANKVTIK